MKAAVELLLLPLHPCTSSIYTAICKAIVASVSYYSKATKMVSQLKSFALFLFCVCSVSNAFTLSMRSSQPTIQKSSLQKISGAVCASCIFLSSISGFAGPSVAAVGEGDLPQGAMSFQKLLKYQVSL